MSYSAQINGATDSPEAMLVLKRQEAALCIQTAWHKFAWRKRVNAHIAVIREKPLIKCAPGASLGRRLLGEDIVRSFEETRFVVDPARAFRGGCVSQELHGEGVPRLIQSRKKESAGLLKHVAPQVSLCWHTWYVANHARINTLWQFH